MKNLTLDDFALFTEIAAARSLSVAARDRHVTASQISRALSRIEAQCELSLAHRTTHGLSLTNDGEIFLAHARQMLEAGQRLEDGLGVRRRSVSGTVRVSVSQLLAKHALIPQVARLAQLHPDLQLELHLDDRMANMAHDAVDVAVRANIAPSETMIASCLGEHGRALYASPAYLRQNGVPLSPASLTSHRLIGNLATPSHNRWQFAVDGVQTSLEVTGHFRVNSSAAVVSLALQGAGIARLNDVVGDGLVAQGRLVKVLPAHVISGTYAIYAVVLAERRRAPRIRATVDFLRTCFADFATRAA